MTRRSRSISVGAALGHGHPPCMVPGLGSTGSRTPMRPTVPRVGRRQSDVAHLTSGLNGDYIRLREGACSRQLQFLKPVRKIEP